MSSVIDRVVAELSDAANQFGAASDLGMPREVFNDLAHGVGERIGDVLTDARPSDLAEMVAALAMRPLA